MEKASDQWIKEFEEKVEKKAKQRAKKKNPKMKVSGKSVFQLQKELKRNKA